MLVLMLLWGVGNFVLIYLVVLCDILMFFYEVVFLDGVGFFCWMWYVILLMLIFVIFFNLVMGII